MGKSLDLGDNKKFCDGIRDLVHKRFQKFNSSFSRLQQDVEDALDKNGVTIVGCHIYLDGRLGSHVVNDLNQLKDQLYLVDLRFEWQGLNIEKIYGCLIAKQENAPVNIELTLGKWHSLKQPRSVFYGLVNAAELVSLYNQHNKLLFENNIRYYLGRQDVNLAIAETVKVQPSELFYLNNGLTITCEKFSLLSGHSQELNRFILDGFSIVNGWQTVGSITSVLINTSSYILGNY